MTKRILITGGAGFVGSNLALHLKTGNPADDIVCLDNLKRRGSELNLPRLAEADIAFVHGDVRNPEDIEATGDVDIIIECSAEPSVQAGLNGSPAYLINTNLTGAVNCFEHARCSKADVIFLSSSRVYPIDALRNIPLRDAGTRLSPDRDATGPGWSVEGISTAFPLTGPRSLYGATKLSAELLLEEYRASYGLRTAINRFGVLAGPWQMGKVDQGFLSLWAARHLFGGALSYNGFGGQGHQVRDILHIADMCRLIALQIDHMDDINGKTFNAGGGLGCSLSLRELTAKCQVHSGREIAIAANPETHDVDIPWYVTDNADVEATLPWTPEETVDGLLEDVFTWLDDNRALLAPIFTQ